MRQWSLWIFLMVLFVAGVVFGSWLVLMVPEHQRESVWNWMKLVYTHPEGWIPKHPFQTWQQAAVIELKWFFLIWLCGLSVAGLPFILVLDFFKGVMTGFTVGMFALSASWKGVLAAAVSMLPVHLFSVPLLIWMSAGACIFAGTVIRERLLRSGGPVFPAFKMYTMHGLAGALLMMGLVWFEVYCVPPFLGWAWKQWPQLMIFV